MYVLNFKDKSNFEHAINILNALNVDFTAHCFVDDLILNQKISELLTTLYIEETYKLSYEEIENIKETVISNINEEDILWDSIESLIKNYLDEILFTCKEQRATF